MFQFKIISSSKLLFSLKTLLLTINCRALYSTKYSWHANYEGFENIRSKSSMAIDKKEICWHRYDFILKNID